MMSQVSRIVFVTVFVAVIVSRIVPSGCSLMEVDRYYLLDSRKLGGQVCRLVGIFWSDHIQKKVT